MANELNVTEAQFSCGVGIIDLNNDMVNEIIIANHNGADRLYIWYDSLYIDMGYEYELSQYANGHHSIALTDVDKDYLPDIYITGEPYYGNHGHLYINQGHPPFSDEAESYNLAEVDEMGSIFFQFTPESELAVLCGGNLMVRVGQTFIDITEGSGFETIANLHCPLFFDMDGDNDDDLFVAGNWHADGGRLFRNNGDTTFIDISFNTNEGGFPSGGGACFGDIDNDGDFDLYMTSSIENSMWENDGTGYFTNISTQSNTDYGDFTRGANFADYDNDGDIDLFINRATDYNMILLNNGLGIFEDYSYEAGVVDYLNGFGCATGDLNNDGQLDIVMANCDDQQNQIYINQNQNNSFLRIKLIGLYPNTLALGAIVDLYGILNDPPDTIYIGKRQMVSHSSMFSFDEPILHFGTGNFEELRAIITFNSLFIVDTSGIIPGQQISIYEDTTTVSIIESKTQLPENYLSIEAYPNPFNSSVKISFTGESTNQYSLKIYNILGRLVKSDIICDNNMNSYDFIWNGTDDLGQPVPSGVYFISVRSKEYVSSINVTLLK